MLRLDPRLLMGATLFATPGLKGGIQMSGLLSVLLVLGVAVIGIFLYRGSRPGPSDPNPGDDWRNRPPPPDAPRPDHPRGGLPLEDADPARVRLRSKARLADTVPRRERRPAREPDREPARTAQL